MSQLEPEGMSAKSALRLEYFIIGLGIVALLMIFGLFLTTATAAMPLMADHPVA